MVRRALMLAFVAVALMATPAGAQYEDGDTTATVTASGIGVTASGFESNAPVDYTVDFVPDAEDGDEQGLGVVGGYEGEIAFAMNVAAPIVIVESGTTMSDSAGRVSFTVENRGPGRYRIEMTDGVTTKVAAITVAGAADGGAGVGSGSERGPLARTGDSSLGLAQLGFAAVAIGSVAIYGAKRRKAKAFA